MRCPSAKDWDRLAMDLLEPAEAERLLAHARSCAACREQFQAARRAHTDRVRMYEAFDRDHDELREQLLAALPDDSPRRSGAGRLVRGWYRLGDYVMSLNTTAGRRAAALLAPAACILIAVAIFLVPDNVVFAAVLERVRQAKTIVCRVEGNVSSGMFAVAHSGQLSISAKHGTRYDMYANGVLITTQYFPQEGPVISVTPLAKMAMRMELSEDARRDPVAGQPDAWIRQLQELTADADRELEADTIDGHEVVGFEIAGEKLGLASVSPREAVESLGRLWVDVETWLPVRYEVRMPGPEVGAQMTVVYDQFEWNVPLEPELFEPDIPEDYFVVDVQMPARNEESLLDGLRFYAELTDAGYPSDLSMARVVGELVARLMVKRSVGASDDPVFQELMQKAMTIGGGCMFYQELVRAGREPEYFGDSVTRDDADQVLLRWKLDDGRLRVIYGDLRIETLPASD
ncbi:MAG: hypothetical protein ACE5I3_12845 [Phycisphaerae bacterium]